VLGGKKAVQTVVIKVAPKKLDCANGTMNEHMLTAVKAEQNPIIEFRMQDYNVAAATRESAKRVTYVVIFVPFVRPRRSASG